MINQLLTFFKYRHKVELVVADYLCFFISDTLKSRHFHPQHEFGGCFYLL